MLRIIQFVVALGFVSKTLAAYGDLRIIGDDRSGRLEFQDSFGIWGIVCTNGFDDEAGDVACRQLGYVRSSDVYTYSSSSLTIRPINVCSTFCVGDEDELIECSLRFGCSSCSGAVGITCTNTLSAGAIAGIVIGTLVFIALITTVIILCFCCFIPTCPCYYRSSHTHTVFVTAQQVPQVVTTTTTATNYQPPAPPVYNANTGYKPYPAAPPKY